MDLGKFLRLMRQEKGLSLRDVEKLCGVSNGYLSLLENGKVDAPSPHILHKLAAAYGIATEQLMDRAGYLTDDKVAFDDHGILSEIADLTAGEIEQVLSYARFIRSKRNG